MSSEEKDPKPGGGSAPTCCCGCGLLHTALWIRPVWGKRLQLPVRLPFSHPWKGDASSASPRPPRKAPGLVEVVGVQAAPSAPGTEPLLGRSSLSAFSLFTSPTQGTPGDSRPLRTPVPHLHEGRLDELAPHLALLPVGLDTYTVFIVLRRVWLSFYPQWVGGSDGRPGSPARGTRGPRRPPSPGPLHCAPRSEVSGDPCIEKTSITKEGVVRMVQVWVSIHWKQR